MGLAHDLLWVNTRYTESKERFIRNFEVMNRKLTDLEREILSVQIINIYSLRLDKFNKFHLLKKEDGSTILISMVLMNKLSGIMSKEILLIVYLLGKDMMSNNSKLYIYLESLLIINKKQKMENKLNSNHIVFLMMLTVQELNLDSGEILLLTDGLHCND